MRYLVFPILVLGLMGTVRPASADTSSQPAITPLRLSWAPDEPTMAQRANRAISCRKVREPNTLSTESKCVPDSTPKKGEMPKLIEEICGKSDDPSSSIGELKTILLGADLNKCPNLKGIAELNLRKESAGFTGSAGSTSGMAGLESVALEGLLTFILNRSRQEVVSFVSTDLLKRLCTKQEIELVGEGNDKTKHTIDLQELFPATCELKSQAEKAKTVLGVGRLMQNALLEDLRGLPLNMAKTLPPSDKPAKDVAVCFLRLSDGVFRGLTRHTPPLTLLAAAAEQMTLDGQCSNALKKLDAKLGEKTLWVGMAVRLAAKQLSSKPNQPQDWIKDALTEFDQLMPQGPERETVKNALAELLPPISQLVALANRPTAAMDSERYKGFLKEVLAATFQILELTIDVSANLAKDAGMSDEQKKALDGLLKGLHGANQILQADYAGGIGTLLMALTGVLDEPKLAGLVKVAGLLTDLSSAKTGDEVATALEKSAAPLGGWRQRRQYSMFSLSAQLGLHAKIERVLADPRPPLGLLFGLSAPVGVDISRPLGESSSLGLFVQVIDLGTVASGRMAALESGTEPKAEPNLGFLQVFSPGASVYVGLGNSPFVLSGSFAYVPSIRTVTLASGDEPRAALQFGLSIAVDLPILPMFRW